MKKIYYHKLIRDKIPEKMKQAGATFVVTRLNHKQYERELIKKVGEESVAYSLPNQRMNWSASWLTLLKLLRK